MDKTNLRIWFTITFLSLDYFSKFPNISYNLGTTFSTLNCADGSSIHSLYSFIGYLIQGIVLCYIALALAVYPGEQENGRANKYWVSTMSHVLVHMLSPNPHGDSISHLLNPPLFMWGNWGRDTYSRPRGQTHDNLIIWIPNVFSFPPFLYTTPKDLNWPWLVWLSGLGVILQI